MKIHEILGEMTSAGGIASVSTTLGGGGPGGQDADCSQR